MRELQTQLAETATLQGSDVGPPDASEASGDASMLQRWLEATADRVAALEAHHTGTLAQRLSLRVFAPSISGQLCLDLFCEVSDLHLQKWGYLFPRSDIIRVGMVMCVCAAQGGEGRPLLGQGSLHALPGASWRPELQQVGFLQVNQEIGRRKPAVQCRW